MKITLSQLKKIIKEEVKDAKNSLLKEGAFGNSEGLLSQTENILGRYWRNERKFNAAKEIVNNILLAAKDERGLDSFDKSSVEEDFRGLAGWMLNYARRDMKKGAVLPDDIDSLADEIYTSQKAKYDKHEQEVLKRAEEQRRIENDRLSKLSPEEQARERNHRMAVAVYGGEENMRRGRGLGT